MSEIEGTLFDTTEDAVVTAKSSGFLVFRGGGDVLSEETFVCFGSFSVDILDSVAFMLVEWHHPGGENGWMWIPLVSEDSK